MQDGDRALAILNRSNAPQIFSISFEDLGLEGSYEIRDLWQHKVTGKGNKWKGSVQSHETRMFRLKKIK